MPFFEQKTIFIPKYYPFILSDKPDILLVFIIYTSLARQSFKDHTLENYFYSSPLYTETIRGDLST
ncbi:MAG: hypothetical protein EWV75_05845 [Microcystis wesenbergii Mw_QC_S_20081001_S30D]|uniref:Uncharacterized protein n=1 Tax=Microcystis wesenbergii Mw_QC_S_20081001_S30D TaxID=2486245 RepID=A0A552JT98_9CHRO|nr:MAG: hypothetical protein EWV73_17250 [Microcystis wesenbergii Mw_QC_B_20070930_S4D]TRU99002.1 MAG: hypothetical protein EWV75_05845 [Microcystis wesenbergii Mw_QC_S_20081001_S30D]TRV02200.1 MAG: hypothetical protein EWV74_09325 [Microcystis wesenbergii Mw_QC_S_20081001_S30]TRV07604.1 MAG: hypothetical protein EWV89_22095 [Microcystis wesenbergii Mw_QC_B_20070930_S4]